MCYSMGCWLLLLVNLHLGAAITTAPRLGAVSRCGVARLHGSHKANVEELREHLDDNSGHWWGGTARQRLGVAAATAMLVLTANTITAAPTLAAETMGSFQRSAPLVIALAEPRDVDDTAKTTLQHAFEALEAGSAAEAEVQYIIQTHK